MKKARSVFVAVAFGVIIFFISAGKSKAFAGYGDMYVSNDGVTYTEVATNPDESNLTYASLGAPCKVSNNLGNWYTLYFRVPGGDYDFVYSEGW